MISFDEALLELRKVAPWATHEVGGHQATHEAAGHLNTITIGQLKPITYSWAEGKELSLGMENAAPIIYQWYAHVVPNDRVISNIILLTKRIKKTIL